jgi:hypothetical protein
VPATPALVPGVGIAARGAKAAKPVMPTALTRAGMTVYCYADDPASHWVRIVARSC